MRFHELSTFGFARRGLLPILTIFFEELRDPLGPLRMTSEARPRTAEWAEVTATIWTDGRRRIELVAMSGDYSPMDSTDSACLARVEGLPAGSVLELGNHGGGMRAYALTGPEQASEPILSAWCRTLARVLRAEAKFEGPLVPEGWLEAVRECTLVGRPAAQPLVAARGWVYVLARGSPFFVHSGGDLQVVPWTPGDGVRPVVLGPAPVDGFASTFTLRRRGYPSLDVREVVRIVADVELPGEPEEVKTPSVALPDVSARRFRVGEWVLRQESWSGPSAGWGMTISSEEHRGVFAHVRWKAHPSSEEIDVLLVGKCSEVGAREASIRRALEGVGWRDSLATQ